MKRWTDGKYWSASKVSGPFLIYKELDSDKTTPKPNGLTKQSFSLTTKQQEKLHLIAYFREGFDSNDLMTPTNDPMLKDIRLDGNIYQEYLLYYDQNGGEDGVLGYPYYYTTMMSVPPPMMPLMTYVPQGSILPGMGSILHPMGSNIHPSAMPTTPQSLSSPSLSSNQMPPQQFQQFHHQVSAQPLFQNSQNSANLALQLNHSGQFMTIPINMAANYNTHSSLNQTGTGSPSDALFHRFPNSVMPQPSQNRLPQTVYPMPMNNYQYSMYSSNYYTPNKLNEMARPTENSSKNQDLQMPKKL